ncbi:hypothetical protein QQ045_030042 [Rhodiola kirilowii]
MAIKLTEPPRRRRFSVRIHPMKLEGGALSEAESSGMTIMVETRLRSENKQSLLSPRKEVGRASSQRVVGKNGGAVEWEGNDSVLENSCSDQCEVDLSFAVLRKVVRKEHKSEKWEEMGSVGMKIGDLGKRKEKELTSSLPIRLQNAGGAMSTATLTVVVSIIAADEASKAGFFKWMPSFNYAKRSNKKKLVMLMKGGADDVGSRRELTRSASLTNLETQSLKKRLGFWQRTGSMLSRRKVEPVAKKMDIDRLISSGAAEHMGSRHDSKGMWEVMEIVSRDGDAELKCSVALASFDQCSEKVAGDGACSAIVAVVAHWLLMNKDMMPSRTELDRLMVEGAIEWKKLGENVPGFPDKHFDIDTVVKAGIRPLRIVQESSVVGFFSPDKFELLKEAACFDGIWNDIESKAGVYIVSWNDHFCVLKVEQEACYLIDSLGKRLVEGCNQAFILKFDDSSVIKQQRSKMSPGASKTQKTTSVVETEEEAAEVSVLETVAAELEDDDQEKIICRGRECCKEFFKRFLAAILVRGLEIKEDKSIVGSSDLHKRLQIEFQYTTCIKK